MNPPVRSFRDLIVWQKAMRLAAEVHRLTRQFPADERYGLTSQVRRAAVSVPSNIAEGHARQGREFAHYLSIARASAAEVETQLLLAVDFSYLSADEIEPAVGLVSEVQRMAMAITHRIRSSAV